MQVYATSFSLGVRATRSVFWQLPQEKSFEPKPSPAFSSVFILTKPVKSCVLFYKMQYRQSITMLIMFFKTSKCGSGISLRTKFILHYAQQGFTYFPYVTMTQGISILALFNKYTFHVYFHIERNEADFWGYTNVCLE